MPFYEFMTDKYEVSLASLSAEGRTAREGLRYLPSHSKYDTYTRIRRREGHNIVAYFVGGCIPDSRDESKTELYAAAIIAVFFPLRDLAFIRATGVWPCEDCAQPLEQRRDYIGLRMRNIGDLSALYKSSDEFPKKGKIVFTKDRSRPGDVTRVTISKVTMASDGKLEQWVREAHQPLACRARDVREPVQRVGSACQHYQ